MTNEYKFDNFWYPLFKQLPYSDLIENNIFNIRNKIYNIFTVHENKINLINNYCSKVNNFIINVIIKIRDYCIEPSINFILNNKDKIGNYLKNKTNKTNKSKKLTKYVHDNGYEDVFADEDIITNVNNFADTLKNLRKDVEKDIINNLQPINDNEQDENLDNKNLDNKQDENLDNETDSQEISEHQKFE